MGVGHELLELPRAQHLELLFFPGDQEEEPRMPERAAWLIATCSAGWPSSESTVSMITDAPVSRDPLQFAARRRDRVGTEEPGAIANLDARPDGPLVPYDGAGPDRHRRPDRTDQPGRHREHGSPRDSLAGPSGRDDSSLPLLCSK